MPEITLQQLNIYPVKSCAPITAESWPLQETGLQYDRQWVITRPNGTFLSQRSNPELVRLSTAIDSNRLIIAAPNIGWVAVSLDRQTDEEREIEIFKKAGTGTDEGDEAANFLSDFMGKPVRLFRNKQPRRTKAGCRTEDASDQIAFADGFQMLLASQKSLTELNKHSPQAIDMARFRPNFVVDGDGLEAYDEDFWRTIKIGSQAGFHVVRACARCPMPNIDQSMGILPKPAERFVTAALKASRRGTDPLSGQDEVFFAQNLSPVLPVAGSIAVGDVVTVASRAKERNFLPD